MESTISLFLMSKKGLETLRAIISNRKERLIEKVICAQDKNMENDYYKDIWNLCKQNNIAVFDKNDNYAIKTNYAIAISWRWLINCNHVKIIVLHDSLLPKYRGFSPLVNALINGEKKIGVTAIFASESFDEGDIISQKQIYIDYPIKIKQAIFKVAQLYTQLIIDILEKIEKQKQLKAIPQNHKNASYSLWRDKQDYYINWNWEAAKISRFVDAVGFPYKGAKTTLNGKEIIIHEVEEQRDVSIENRDVGKVLFFKNKKPIVVCGKGLILVKCAEYEIEKKSIFPLKHYRTRFR